MIENSSITQSGTIHKGVRTASGKGKHELHLYLSFALFVFGLVYLSNPFLLELHLLAFLILYFIFSIWSLRYTAIIAIFLIPLAGLIKWTGGATAFIILFQSIMFIVALLTTFFHVVLNQGLKVSSIPKTLFLPFTPFIVILTYHTLIVAVDSPIRGLAYFREYILPLLLFFVFFYALKNKSISVTSILYTLSISTTLVAVVNLLHYFFGLESEYPRYVSVDGFPDTPQLRGIFGLIIPRAQHLLGLGSQGGGAVFYAITGFLSLLLAQTLRRWEKIILVCCAMVLFLAGAVVFSGSFILSLIFLALFYKLFATNTTRSVTKTSISLVLISMPGYILLSNNMLIGSHSQFLSYGFVFIDYGIALLEYAITNFIMFGHGLELLGFYETNNDISKPIYFDTWIFSVTPQIGLFGFLSMVLSWFYWILLVTLKNDKNKAFHIENATVGIILVGSLAYSHQAAFVARLMMPLIIIALSILAFKYSSLSSPHPINESKT